MADKTTILKSPGMSTSRKLFSATPMSGGASIHFSGMNTGETPQKQAVTLIDVSLMEIYDKSKGDESVTSFMETEFKSHMMKSVLTAENVKKFGELELTENDPSKLTEFCDKIAQETATYAGELTRSIMKHVLDDMQPIVTENLSSMLSDTGAKVSNEARPHVVLFMKVVEELASFAADLENTKTTEGNLGARKKHITSELRKSWSITDDPNSESEPAVEGAEASNAQKQAELEEVDKKLATLSTYSKSVRDSIKSLLAENYGAPDIDWNSEPKTVRAIKLDAKLAGAADPTLAENLIVNVRSFLHSYVSKFWALIPFLECMDENRSHPEHLKFPCEANDYGGVPQSLLETYKSQSATLFQHLWTSMNGSTQIGSTILRKTFAEKFLGEVLDADVSVKSSRNDGMMSIFWLLTVHESAGYVEKAKLKSTLHQSASLFFSGNPQSKMEAIRIVVDKAVTLRVKIDFEATVKPIVMTLRKRSPNFNELATKYLKPQNFPDWDEQGLHVLDTLLSEIDHIVDTLGMQGNMQDIADVKSKAHETSAKAAFAFYTGAAVQPVKPAGTNNDKKGGMRCGALGCTNMVAASVQAKAEKIRRENPEKNYIPPICSDCMGKLKDGSVQSIKCVGNKQRKLWKPEEQYQRDAKAKHAAKKAGDKNKSAQPTGVESGDFKSTMKEIMRETIMEMQSGVKDEAPEQLQIEDQPEANPTGTRSASFVESLLASGK